VFRHVVGISAPVIALAGLSLALIYGSAPLIGVGVSVAVAILVGVASELHARMHPLFDEVAPRLSLTLGILPGLLTLAAGLAVVYLWGIDPLLLRAVPLLGALSCALAIVAQNYEVLQGDDSHGWPRALCAVLTYLAAFVLFTAIYQSRERGLITATAASIVSGLLSIVLLRATAEPRARILLFALVIGLCSGEVMWMLNYWVVIPITGGAVLLVFFYVFVGVADGVLSRELNRRLLLEYMIVGLVGFLLTLSTAPWRP
jgi:hypothetical protein